MTNNIIDYESGMKIESNEEELKKYIAEAEKKINERLKQQGYISEKEWCEYLYKLFDIGNPNNGSEKFGWMYPYED